MSGVFRLPPPPPTTAFSSLTPNSVAVLAVAATPPVSSLVAVAVAVAMALGVQTEFLILLVV